MFNILMGAIVKKLVFICVCVCMYVMEVYTALC